MNFVVKILRKILGRSESPVPGAVLYGDKKYLELGENVSFGGNVMLQLNAKVTIGANTMIGCGSIIHTATHDYEAHPMWAVRKDSPVEIGSCVWIGMGALLFPGVRVGNHAVVGAGAVVTKNIPEGAIVAGNPARVIKYRDPEVYSGKPEFNRKDVNVEILKAGFMTESLK